MNRHTDPPPSLAARSQMPADRILYYEEADESLLAEIACGVLFVMAFWSGPSVEAFMKLTEELARLDPEGKLRLVVVDTDGLPDLPSSLDLLDRRGGYGETAWVKEGSVIRSVVSWRAEPDCFAANTAALLAECGL
jgi:hypothetical protein